MTPRRWFVWLWLDENGDPAYLGKAHIVGREHPADVLWDRRHENHSPLGQWLSSLKKEPKRDQRILVQAMHHQNAQWLYNTQLEDLREKNCPLYSSRPIGTKAGGGNRRMVEDPLGKIHESVRAAAKAWEMSPASVTNLCQSLKSGWDYL